MDSFNKNRITDALKANGAELPCPRCGHATFALIEGYLVHFIQSDFKNLQIGGGPSIPTIATVCTRCGFMSEHAIGALGLLPKQDEKETE
jgi:ribosomal protein S27AE